MFSKREYANKDQSAKDYVCLSTDAPLPTDGITNGSKCIEMDTGKTYMFNEEDSEWVELPSSGGGGGGGSSDFSTAEVTIVNTLEEDFAELFPFLDDNVLRVSPIDFDAGETQVLKMPIPTGGACVFSTILIGTVSGDIAFEAGILTITGNGTFTVTGLD